MRERESKRVREQERAREQEGDRESERERERKHMVWLTMSFILKLAFIAQQPVFPGS